MPDDEAEPPSLTAAETDTVAFVPSEQWLPPKDMASERNPVTSQRTRPQVPRQARLSLPRSSKVELDRLSPNSQLQCWVFSLVPEEAHNSNYFPI